MKRSSLHLRVYTDASFVTNDDMPSKLGYVILLCDADDNCHILAYSSRKYRRVVRSIMAVEFNAFSYGFNVPFMMRHDLEMIYRQKIAIMMLTDSKQIFDVITRATHTSEKSLMIDIFAARQAYRKG